jgi:hypothetical protein
VNAGWWWAVAIVAWAAAITVITLALRWLAAGDKPPCHRCGHPCTAHQHYRPGTDCGRCPCPAYKPGDWDQAYKRELAND